MTLWIPLTSTHIELLVSDAQRESLAARRNLGFDNDLLTLAIAEVTLRLRLAIRENATNQLSEDISLLPPEMIPTSAMLCLGALQGKLPGFQLTDKQLDMLDLAISRLSEIASGDLPVSLPTNPEPSSPVRRTAGIQVERHRSHVIVAVPSVNQQLQTRRNLTANSTDPDATDLSFKVHYEVYQP